MEMILQIGENKYSLIEIQYPLFVMHGEKIPDFNCTPEHADLSEDELKVFNNPKGLIARVYQGVKINTKYYAPKLLSKEKTEY